MELGYRVDACRRNALMSRRDNGTVLNMLSCMRTYIQQDYFILDAAEARQAEGIRVLNAVLDIRERAPKRQPGETARVLHALAMLYYLITDLAKVSFVW